MDDKTMKAISDGWTHVLGVMFKPTPAQRWLQNLPTFVCVSCGRKTIFDDCLCSVCSDELAEETKE